MNELIISNIFMYFYSNETLSAIFLIQSIKSSHEQKSKVSFFHWTLDKTSRKSCGPETWTLDPKIRLQLFIVKN